MRLDLFNYTLAGIRSLFELKACIDSDAIYTSPDKENEDNAKAFLKELYSKDEFNKKWVMERERSNIFLINQEDKRVLIPVVFSDHPHFKPRSYKNDRYIALSRELRAALKEAHELALEVIKQNGELKVSVLALDYSLGYIFDTEEGSELCAYNILNDIKHIDEIRRQGLEYFILYSPLKHMPTPGFDEIGECFVGPRIAIMDSSYKGGEGTRNYTYANFDEVNLY